MSSKLYAQRGKIGLVAGLNWSQLLKTGKARAAEIRALASEAEASKIVVVEAPARAAVGLYAPPDLDDDNEAAQKAAKPKVMHSLAALFAAKVGDGKAVLALSLEGVSQAAIVVVEDGVPQLDEIKGAEEAQALAMQYASGSSGFTYSMYTNDAASFASGEHIDVDELWALASHSTQLGARPANVAALVGVVITALVVSAGGYGFLEYQKVEARKERIRLAARSNPTPKYEAAFASQRSRLGMNREDAQRVMAVMRRQPLWVDGWLLSKVECRLGEGTCSSTWARAGGTTDALLAARRAAGEEIAGDSTNNVVRLTYKVDMVESGISSRESLPTAQDSITTSTPTFQIWENASIKAAVGSDGYKAWPQLPDIDPKAVDVAVVVKARPIEVTSPVVLATEVVATAPSNVWWSSITFDVKVSTKPTDSLHVILKGNSYVR